VDAGLGSGYRLLGRGHPAMKLTKADAARQLGIARSTLYKLIDQGKVSPAPDGRIDSAELVRVAAYVDVLHERTRTPVPIAYTATTFQDETPHGRPQTGVRVQRTTGEYGRPQTSVDTVVDMLRAQLDILREELQAARQNAQAAQEREALLLRMLHESQQRYDRLLDVPRPVPQADPPPQRRERRTPPPVSVPTAPLPGTQDMTTPMPTYNPETHMLGVLCPQGHDWQGTGQSLRKRSNTRCLACDAAWARAKRRGRSQDG
jgi:DNA-binding XRE family transcriptional regulator